MTERIPAWEGPSGFPDSHISVKPPVVEVSQPVAEEVITPVEAPIVDEVTPSE